MKREICSRFIYSLKIKNILQKYIWYFDFYSRFQGYFYLGSEPHFYNIENNSYKSSEYIKINSALSKNGYVEWNLLFDEITFKNISNSYMFNLNDKMAENAFNLGLIVGTFEFQKFIEENYFNELTNKGICRRTLINYFSEEKKAKTKYYVYKCNEAFKNKIYQNTKLSYYALFPKIEFIKIDLKSSLTLDRYDLFEKINK